MGYFSPNSAIRTFDRSVGTEIFGSVCKVFEAERRVSPTPATALVLMKSRRVAFIGSSPQPQPTFHESAPAVGTADGLTYAIVTALVSSAILFRSPRINIVDTNKEIPANISPPRK